MVPVCAPALIRPEHPLKEPADLEHYQLLHYDYPQDVTTWPDWQMWLTAAGVTNVDFRRGIRFREVSILLDAAARGHGVALTGDVYINDALTAGELIRPFDLSFPQEFAYYMVTLESAENDERIMAFRNWVLEEVGDPDSRSTG